MAKAILKKNNKAERWRTSTSKNLIHGSNDQNIVGPEWWLMA
jgi:hypothetical protein